MGAKNGKKGKKWTCGTITYCRNSPLRTLAILGEQQGGNTGQTNSTLITNNAGGSKKAKKTDVYIDVSAVSCTGCDVLKEKDEGKKCRA